MIQLVDGQKFASYITKLGYNGLVEVWEGNVAITCELRCH